jgi:5-methylphenazine-1-carboxylate 1-monooxygenase
MHGLRRGRLYDTDRDLTRIRPRRIIATSNPSSRDMVMPESVPFPQARVKERRDADRHRGGGIGGMTLALAFHDAGIDDIEVYESAPAIKELGVGINVQPHAVRELTELGLLDDLAEVGIPTTEFVLYSKHGQRIWREPRGLAAGYRWPQFSIHRGELLGILHRAVVARLGPDRIHTGHHLACFGQEGDRIWSEFVDRASRVGIGRVEADLLVSCDGIHAVVRQTLYPDEGPPKWNGITMWRAVIEGERFLSGRTMIMTGYFGRRVVAYPISKRHESQGRALINWVAEVKTADPRLSRRGR